MAIKKFRIGDRVVFTASYGALGPQVGDEGEIVKISLPDVLSADYTYGVKLDKRKAIAHTCGGRTKPMTGWYAKGCNMELIPDELEQDESLSLFLSEFTIRGGV